MEVQRYGTQNIPVESSPWRKPRPERRNNLTYLTDFVSFGVLPLSDQMRIPVACNEENPWDPWNPCGRLFLNHNAKIQHFSFPTHRSSPLLNDTHRLSLIGLCSISMILSYRNHLVYARLTLPALGRAGRSRYPTGNSRSLNKSEGEHLAIKLVKGEPQCQPLALIMC